MAPRRIFAARRRTLDRPRSGSRWVNGPFVARDLSLAVKPAFQSQTVAKDPDAAKSLYVTHLPLT